MPESDNPYAPPVASVTPPPVHGWSVQGGYLLVRDGTVLPEVDLDGRGAAGPLTPVALMFPATTKGRAGLGVAIGLATGMAVVFSRDAEVSPAMVMIGAFALATLIMAFSAGRIGMVSVKGFLSLAALRARQRKTRWRSWLTWSGVLVFLAGVLLLPSASSPPEGVRVFAGLALPCSLLLIFGSAIWQMLDRRLTCIRIQDGWLYLRDVGPAALAALGPRSGEPIPPPRLRKVYTVFLHRSSFATLFRPYPRNPWAWLYLALLKLQRSKALEVRVFHDAEREWLPVDLADADLRAAWERSAAGTPLADWRPVVASSIDGPLGNVRVHDLVLLSPDGHHLARLQAVRAATQKVFMEFSDTFFHSWTQDGRLIATGSGPRDAPALPGQEYHQVKGQPWKIAQAHLARVAPEALAVIAPDDVRHRLRDAFERSWQAGFAAAIYGPVEEIELPAPHPRTPPMGADKV